MFFNKNFKENYPLFSQISNKVIKDLQKDKAELENDSEELKKLCETLQKENERLLKEKKEIDAKLNDYEKVRKLLEEKIKQNPPPENAHQILKDGIMKELEHAEDKIKILESENEKLKIEPNKLQELCKSLQAENARLIDAAKDLNNSRKLSTSSDEEDDENTDEKNALSSSTKTIDS